MSNTKRMRYLLYSGIFGFSLWGISEVIEIVNGYNSAVYYLTAAYHFLAGFGIWGLHRTQSKGSNNLSKTGAAISLIAYLGLTFFPIQVMQSGLSLSEFVEANPIYKMAGGVWFVGMIIFGVSLLRTKYFPTWTAIVFILGTINFTATPMLKWPTLPVNITNIALAATVIYMCGLGLKESRNMTAVGSDVS